MYVCGCVEYLYYTYTAVNCFALYYWLYSYFPLYVYTLEILSFDLFQWFYTKRQIPQRFSLTLSLYIYVVVRRALAAQNTPKHSAGGAVMVGMKCSKEEIGKAQAVRINIIESQSPLPTLSLFLYIQHQTCTAISVCLDDDGRPSIRPSWKKKCI